ncbi:MAG TPA: TIR domain-containing protein [Caulobacteraceae bacterium]|nr:TIR domain-containing protein [Caulobacteraceae bacterium]
MSDVFISYARSTAKQAQAAAEALKALGYSVWLDDELLAHHAYTHAIEEQLTAAKVALVIWSAEGVKSEWVLSEANRAREDHKLVQLTVDGARLPMPFDQTQCADLVGWTGDASASGWLKVTASIAELIGATTVAAAPVPALALPSKPSIAVMPFANLSGDSEQDYFVDGMVDEITNALSRFRSLFVIASSSTLTFKGKAIGAQEAAKQLGVRYVLEGNVRKAGNRVRISVKLIDAEDGAQIWAQRFEDSLDDVFALQDSVAGNVAGAIDDKLVTVETQRASKRPTNNRGSYDLYLLANKAFFTEHNPLAALELLDRALALDPDYGQALSLAAACHNRVVFSRLDHDLETHRRRGLKAANRALEVGRDDATVAARAASVLLRLGGDADLAAVHIDRALTLNPGSPFVWFFSAMLQVWLGEPERAIEHIETAIRLDPLSSNHGPQMHYFALARFQQGRFDDALQLLKQGAFTTRTHAAIFAAIHGHLKQSVEAGAALAQYAKYAGLAPIENAMDGVFHRPEHLKLYRDGIALAQGKTPEGGAA